MVATTREVAVVLTKKVTDTRNDEEIGQELHRLVTAGKLSFSDSKAVTEAIERLRSESVTREVPDTEAELRRKSSVGAAQIRTSVAELAAAATTALNPQQSTEVRQAAAQRLSALANLVSDDAQELVVLADDIRRAVAPEEPR